eukprot:4939574-Pyramimonas_sp.AAC.1
MQVSTIPLPGCARFPPVARWARAEHLIANRDCDQSFSVAWDAMLCGLEHELLGRHAIVPDANGVL